MERNEPLVGELLGSGRAVPAGGFGVGCSIANFTCGSSMGIKFLCPNGHKLNVKSFLAGKKGVCPECRERFVIPVESTPKQRVASIGVSNVGAQVDEEVVEDAADEPAEVASAFGAAAPHTAVAAHSAAATIAVASAPASTAAPISHFAPTPSPATVPAPVPAPTPALDPLDEAPNAQWYVRPPTGGQFGPARADLLRRWIGEGRVSADSLVWREGWADWKPAGGLLPGIASPTAAPSNSASATSPATRSSNVSPVVGAAAGPTAPNFLAGQESAAIGAVSPAPRAVPIVSRKSSNLFPIVIVLALMAIVMLVVLIWVIMSN